MNIRRIQKNPPIYQFGLLRHWNKNILVVKQWLGTHLYSPFTNATFAPPLLFSSHVFVACDRVRERCSEKGTMREHLCSWTPKSNVAHLHFFRFAAPIKGPWRFFASTGNKRVKNRLPSFLPIRTPYERSMEILCLSLQATKESQIVQCSHSRSWTTLTLSNCCNVS